MSSGQQEEQKASNEMDNELNSVYLSNEQVEMTGEIKEPRILSAECFGNQSILKSQIVEAKNELDFLVCPICINILFKPISCSECTQSFCKDCIDQWTKAKQQPSASSHQPAAVAPANSPASIMYMPSPLRHINQEDDEDDRPFLFNSQRVPSDAESMNPLGHSSSIHQQIQSQQQQQQQNTQLMQSQGLGNNNNNRKVTDNRQCCPICKKPFRGVNMPLIKKLLGSMKLSCFYSMNGCNEIISYDSYEKHCLDCMYQGFQCKGCSKVFVKSEIEDHVATCEDVVHSCHKCQFEQPKKHFFTSHTTTKCFQLQLTSKDRQIEMMNERIDGLASELSSCVNRMGRLFRGVPEHVSSFPFQTVFTNHFRFEESKAVLLVNSFNESKKKFDFLHFFLNKPFYIHSPVPQVFKVTFDRLQGNILMGVSDSQLQNSMDFMVNRQGEIKKKEKSDNKYKQKDRASNFTIQERNTILIKYLPFLYTVEFHNLELNVTCRFDSSYMLEFPEKFFFFFSLDHQEDTIVFSSA